MASNNKVLTYIKTGYLLHCITVCELALLYILLYPLHVGEWMLETDTTTRFFILLPLLWSPIFPQLDARSRYQDYKMMKDYFYLYGFDARLVKHVAKSRCQRDAVIVAAREMGVEAECMRYFNNRGYKWYHLFPDIIFDRPAVLLSKSFWATTFFTKTYHPKFDHTAINVSGRAKPADLQVKAA